MMTMVGDDDDDIGFGDNGGVDVGEYDDDGGVDVGAGPLTESGQKVRLEHDNTLRDNDFIRRPSNISLARTTFSRQKTSWCWCQGDAGGRFKMWTML